MLNNRTTFMERLNDRVAAIEALLQKLEPVEGLLERLTLLEENIYTTKTCLPLWKRAHILVCLRVCSTS